MSEKSTGARPSQVTVAGWVAVTGSALLVMTLLDSAGRLRSVEFRDAVEEFLATPVGGGLGLEVGQIVDIVRVLTMVSGAAAAAALVLAVFVLQRHRGARIGYTVAAVIVMVTAPASGSLFPVMLAFAAMMLWTKPARDWFAGVPVTAADPSHRHSETHVTQDSSRPDRPDPHMPEDSGARPVPPPTEGFGAPQGHDPQRHGQQHGQQHGQPPPQAYGQPQYPPYGYPPQAQAPYGGGYPAPQADRGERPTNVTIATWVTWALSALTLFGFVMIAFVLLVAREEFLSQIEQDPTFQEQLGEVDLELVIAALWVMVVVSLVWCLVAIVLAWFAFRGANWARIALVVSAGVAALFSILSFPVGLIHLVAAGAVIALLFTGGSNEWYAGRSGRQRGGPGPYPPYGSQYGQPYGQQQYGGPPPQGQPPQGQPPQGRPPQGQAGEGEGRGPDQERGRGKDEPPPNVW